VSSIELAFNFETNAPGSPNSFDCGDFFDVDTLATFGRAYDGSSRNQYCSWLNNYRLKISFGAQPTVLPGYVLQFNDATDCGTWICHRRQLGRMKFSSKSTVEVPNYSGPDLYPEAITQGPAAVGLCENTTIVSMSKGGYGRELLYDWQLPGSFEAQGIDQCAGIVTYLSELNIPNSCTSHLSPISLTFLLEVTNWLNFSDFTEFTIEYSNSIVPAVSVLGGIVHHSSPLVTLEIPINVAMPSCLNYSYALQYSWKQGTNERLYDFEGSDSVTVNNHPLQLSESQTRTKNLVLPAYTTKWGEDYTFVLTVTFYNSINNFTLVYIRIAERPMPTVRSSPDIIFSSSTNNEFMVTDFFNFYSDVKESETWWEDVDYSEEATIRALYYISWTCSLESSDDDCGIPLPSDNVIYLRYDSGQVSQHFTIGVKYIITAHVESQKTGVIVTGSFSLRVEEVEYPIVRVFPDTISLSIGEQITFVVEVVKSTDIGNHESGLRGKEILEFYNISWSTSPSLENDTYAFTNYESTATLDTSALTNKLLSKVVVNVRVTPIDNSEVSYEGNVYKSITAVIVKPPRMGYCEVHPKTGLPLTTLFVARCEDWVGQSSLQYQFGYRQLDTTSNIHSTLRTYSRSSYHKFTLGPGNFTIVMQVKDKFGAVAEQLVQVSCDYSSERGGEIAADQLKYIKEFSTHIDDVHTAASMGDVSSVLSSVALLNSAIDYISPISDAELLNEVTLLKGSIIDVIGELQTSASPTVHLQEAIISMLLSTVSDWTLLLESSTPLVANQLEAVVDSLSILLRDEHVSKFPSEDVAAIVDTANYVVKATYSQDTSDMTTLQRLINITRNCLRGSLTDTQPGQIGFEMMTSDSSGYLSAKRVRSDNFATCSTDKTWLPDFIPEFRSIESADCITMLDGGVTIGLGRRLDLGVGQESASVTLYDSSGDIGSEPVPITSLDTCTPIVYFLESVGIHEAEFGTLATDTVAAAQTTIPAAGKMDHSFPYCMSRENLGDEWKDRGCLLIGWEGNRTWCSCTQLFEISLGSENVTISLDKIVTRDNNISLDMESVSRNSTSLISTIMLLLLIMKILPEARLRFTDMELLAHPYIYTNNRFELLGVNSAFFKRIRASATKKFCSRWWKLFKWEARNSHPVTSIWYRDMGTNYTGHQRIFVVLVCFAVALSAQAIYYGVTYMQSVDEVTQIVIVAFIICTLSFLAKYIFERNATRMFRKNVFEAEQGRMQDCRAICRYAYGCCFCAPFCCNHKKSGYSEGEEGASHGTAGCCTRTEILRTTRQSFFPAYDFEKDLLSEETDYIVADRRGEISQYGLDHERLFVNLREEGDQIRILNKMQSIYLRKSPRCPNHCRIITWTLLSIILFSCCIVIISFGPNLDRDEFSEPDSDTAAAGTSHCKTWLYGGKPMQLDVPMSSALQLVAANASAVIKNDRFERYPEPSVEIYPEETTESLRFVMSAFLTWILGMICIPLLINLVGAFIAAVNNCRFSNHMVEIAEKTEFKGREKLSQEDFKFLLVFFPLALLQMGDGEVLGKPILQKGRCSRYIMPYRC